MQTVNIHEAKTHLSRLVDDAAAGAEIVIAKAGKPVARLMPLEAAKERRRLGAFAGKFTAPTTSTRRCPTTSFAPSKNRCACCWIHTSCFGRSLNRNDCPQMPDR
jgi:prevent-host-death family protein